VTSIETEALHKPDALPYGIDSRKGICSDCGSETVITFYIAIGRATRPRQRRRSTHPRNVTAPIGVHTDEGLRAHVKTKPPDSIGDESRLFPALTSKRNTTLGGSHFRLTARTGPGAQPQDASRPPSVGRRIRRGNQPKPIQGRSMFTDQ
jgi:hypothetical protein